MYSEAKAQPHNDSKQEMDWIGGQGQKSLGFPTHIGNTHYFAWSHRQTQRLKGAEWERPRQGSWKPKNNGDGDGGMGVQWKSSVREKKRKAAEKQL